MNTFLDNGVAGQYDNYYQTEAGKKIDNIEKQLISKLINDLPKGEMLELGCGTGHWTAFFVENGFSPVAVDVSEAMLEIAKEKDLPVEFKKADANELPFEKNSFQLVASITMLEFVEDIDKVLHEIYRVLKPNGHLILGCLNARSELGKNKESDDVFKDADFLTPEALKDKLRLFGNPKIEYGVRFSPEFKIMDNSPEASGFEPAFMAVLVQKTN